MKKYEGKIIPRYEGKLTRIVTVQAINLMDAYSLIRAMTDLAHTIEVVEVPETEAPTSAR